MAQKTHNFARFDGSVIKPITLASTKRDSSKDPLRLSA